MASVVVHRSPLDLPHVDEAQLRYLLQQQRSDSGLACGFCKCHNNGTMLQNSEVYAQMDESNAYLVTAKLGLPMKFNCLEIDLCGRPYLVCLFDDDNTCLSAVLLVLEMNMRILQWPHGPYRHYSVIVWPMTVISAAPNFPSSAVAAVVL